MNTEEKLARFLPIRVIVRLHEGKIQGYVEHSFSMAWNETHVGVCWSGKAHSMLGEHELDCVAWAENNLNKHKVTEFALDPLAADSPIQVDWDGWLEALAREPGDRFSKRNAPFTVAPQGLHMLRAMAAERELTETLSVA